MKRALFLSLMLFSLAGVASAAAEKGDAPKKPTPPSGPVRNAANDAYKKSLGTPNPLPKPSKPAKPAKPGKPDKPKKQD